MRRTQSVFWGLALIVLTTDLQAGSLMAKRGKNNRNFYTDDVAHCIGDVLTVKITEDSKVDNKAKRDLSKSTSRSSDFDGKLNIGHALPSMPGLTMDAQSSNSLSGKADYKEERSFEDQITVVVMDVLPNRNLVIQGARDRQIAGDVQTLEVSGIVRPSDIAFDNTIKSEQIANFRVVTKYNGVAAPYTKPGWLGRFFDFLWPF